MQGIESASEAEPPVLWAVEELAAPVAERLRAHFAAGRQTDRPDKPEWLFGTALRLVISLITLEEANQNLGLCCRVCAVCGSKSQKSSLVDC